MNNYFEGGNGLYRAAQFAALTEPGRWRNPMGKVWVGARSLLLAAMALTILLAVLLANGTGF